MELLLNNSHSYLSGASDTLTQKLVKLTSYRTTGYQFAPSFRNGFWDGYIKLLKMTRERALKIPTGLLPDVFRVIENSGGDLPTIKDERKPLGERRDLPWLDPSIIPRDYQQEAVALAASGPIEALPGRGILKLPIRSGKTVIAALLLRHWGRRALFVGTSQLINEQTHKLFTRLLGPDIGLISDGVFDPGFITVASVQRLQRLDPPVVKLLNGIDALLVDEVHHMRGDSWREPILNASARYKIGLSATVTLSRKLCERSAVWLKSAAGPLLMDVPMSRLVDDGYIMSPDIFLATVNTGKALAKASYQRAYDKLIVENDARNDLCCEAARIMVESGMRVLIDTGRLDHIKRLYSGAKKRSLDASIIYGNTPSAKRAEIIRDFVEGRKPVMIGTVMGEGVDVPILSGVINAEGGKDPGATIQRMRNLTKHPSKARAITVDFMDVGNRYLVKHAKARLATYRKESAFNVTPSVPAADFATAFQSAVGK
jgi:superfamily II DNA or RNA helicase